MTDRDGTLWPRFIIDTLQANSKFLETADSGHRAYMARFGIHASSRTLFASSEESQDRSPAILKMLPGKLDRDDFILKGGCTDTGLV